uniref:Synaptotagmin-like protein 1 n=1 Tax=Oryzias latipes TaxID=8090 RepID=A0A3P9KJ64_ORYLA
MSLLVHSTVTGEIRANDNTFETSFGHRRNTNSSISDMSFSSEMDSVSPMSSSLNSICPADVRDTEVQGSIQFALTYIQKLGEFQIFVVLCRGLAVADPKKNRTDPYVKCSLLPDKTKLGKKKTSVKKKTLSPTYNEVLGFKIPMEVLRIQHLNITVGHKDTFGRSSFLGEVDLDLSVWDFSNTQINEFPLKAKVLAVSSSTMNSRGEMRVALRFLQQPPQKMGEVQIWVKDCKNLLPVRGSMINPFVKCTVLPDMSSKSRQKTRVVKRTVNPMFNHTMVYEGFRPDDLREICVEITVWDQDHLKNYYIGGLRLGLGTGRSYEVDVVWMDSTAHEVNLWNRMLKSNAEWVEEVLPLRLLAGAANSVSK